MFSGFQTGNNKKLQIQENDQANKLVCLLENLSDEDDNFKSENKITKSDLNIFDSISKQEIKQNSKLYHPSKLGQQQFQFINKKQPDSFSDKKISFQTVIINENNYNSDQKELISEKKEITFQEQLLFEKNEILLSKISKLSKCLIGEKMFQIINHFKKNNLIIPSTFQRSQIKPLQYNCELIKTYFSKTKAEKQWVKQQSQLVAWKLHSKQNLNDINLILELEYRYYIQYVLQSRTIIQQIWTKDVPLFQHLILLVVNKDYVSQKLILELSDGWYSLFFVCEYNYTNIYNKIQMGQKLHIMNLQDYPILFDTSKSEMIQRYLDCRQFVTTKINSIKKACFNSKLGQQKEPYFIRSLQSLRNGIIPCIDVFIIAKSYLILTNGNYQKKAIEIHSESQQDINGYFLIEVIDSLNYFDNQNYKINESKEIKIYFNTENNLYEQLFTGQRIRIINASQQNGEISVKQEKNQGIITDIIQFSDYFKKIIYQLNKIELILQIQSYHKTQQQHILYGLSEHFGFVNVELDNQFFSDIIQKIQQINQIRWIQISSNINDQIFKYQQLQMNHQFLRQPSTINDRSFLANHKYYSPRLDNNESLFENNSDRYSAKDLRRFIGNNKIKRKLKQRPSRVFDNEENQQKEKRIFKQSLQKLFEETFLKNLIDNSYIKKLRQLTTYQVSVLDDLQFGTDKQVDDIDNIFYRVFSKYLDKISLIQPQSNFKIFWNCILILTFITVIVWLPYKLAFETNYISQLYSSSKSLYLEIVFFSILSMDIIISLNEAYIHKGIIINQRYHILIHYFKTMAFTDIVSTMAILYELIVIHFNGNEEETPYIYADILICLTFGILKIIKIKKIVDQIQEYFNIKGIIKDYLKLAQMLGAVLYLIHLIGCTWHGLGYINTMYTWLDKNHLREYSSRERYMISLQWAAALISSAGESEISMANNNEFLFSTIIQIISMIVLGIMIVVMGYIFQKHQQDSIYQESMKVMNNFMSMNNIDFNLQVRIRNYLDYICAAEQSMLDENVNDIVSKLSENLQAELKHQLRASILEQCDFITKNFSQKFRKSLVGLMQEINTIPEERVINMNEIDDSSIFIINKGEMEVVFEKIDTMKVKTKRNNMKTLEKGEYFGFYGFVSGQHRTASIISKGFGKLFKIQRSDFLQLLNQFPDDREIFYMIKDTVCIHLDMKHMQTKCYGCKSINHMVNTCPSLHYNPDQDRVLKQALYPFSQERDDPYQPRKSKFINALLYQQVIEQIARELQLKLIQDETVAEGTQATHVLLQDDLSDTDSRTYSQMRTRSVSRAYTHSILSMQQQSSNNKIQQQQLQQMVQQQTLLPRVDEDEVEMNDEEDEEENDQQNEEEELNDQVDEMNSNNQQSFDQQMDRKEFNRKNDPKHTVETAGFGQQLRKFQSKNYDNNNSGSNFQESEDSDEDHQSSQQNSNEQNQVKLSTSLKGSHSPNHSTSQKKSTHSQQQKMTFMGPNNQQNQIIVQSNPNNPNAKPRTSIRRTTTKTSNTAVIFDNVMQQLQDNQSYVIEFPIITLPSIGEFDKIMTFRKYFPQHNIKAVLNVIKRFQKQTEHQIQFSLYSFIFTAIQRGKELRKQSEISKNLQKTTIFYTKTTNKPQLKVLKRQMTQKQM